MFSKTYTNYLLTHDEKKIFFQTNFPHHTTPNEKVIMFNYGLVCSNHHWSKQFKYFNDHQYNIIIHDFRGHFNSTGHEDIESITIENIASDMKGILDFLNIKTCSMIGHSMGVNVTLEFAKLYPQYLHKMALICGTVMPVNEVMFDTNLMDLILPYVEMLFEKFPKEMNTIWKSSGVNPLIQHGIMQGGFNTKKVSLEFIQIYLNRIAQLTPELFFQLFKQMTVHDILCHLEMITTKSLIIGGEKDKVIPPYLQILLKSKLPNSELYLIKDGSHVPQVDFPDQLNERLDLFFN